jgi:hypothetical protein
MAKTKNIVDEVIDSLPKRRGFAPWYENLPADVLEQCNTVKSLLKEGRVGTKTAVAHRLSSSLKARGIDIGYPGVLKWLEKA